ncbi:MAG: DUF721 domain-containing protein [Candidatus Omnitrophica bacterium]|nr:DUF721 domain-containing protein [Candidatus Omnitrophota bacterium]
MQLLKEILPGVFSGFQNPENQKRNRLMENWPAIAGARIAPHTKPSLLRDGRLVVWVDESALAYELSQKHRQSLLKRTQAVMGEENITSVRFRVGQLR